jgi:hypothetical protein
MNEITSAMDVMRIMPSTKDEVTRFASQLIEQVQNGSVNPIQLKAAFKMVEQVGKQFDAATKENQMIEAERYPKTFNAYGFEIQRTELGTEYDYLSTGDPVYAERHAAVESAKSLLNERAAFLRSVKEPTTILHEQTGEIVTITPPLKKSTTGLKFTIQ